MAFSVSRSTELLQPFIAGVLAGLAASIVEMITVVAIQGAMGVGAMRVLQAIASGLLGASAYSGGSTAAALGLFLHIAISLAAGVVFALAASRWRALIEHPMASSMAFGVGMYLVMSTIVLPLSAAAFPISNKPILVATSVSTHIFAFALPIVVVTRKMLRKNGE